MARESVLPVLVTLASGGGSVCADADQPLLQNVPADMELQYSTYRLEALVSF